MEASEIVTSGDFRSYLLFLAQGIAKTYQGSLEEYLRALLATVQQNAQSQVTFALIGKVLFEAFTTEPFPFNEDWLTYQEPPDLTIDGFSSIEDDYGYLQHMILYQIADFHLIEASGVLQKQWSVLGVTSPTGNSWYNFDPVGFLFCAAQGMRENSPDTNCTWVNLAITLWLGQIYE